MKIFIKIWISLFFLAIAIVASHGGPASNMQQKELQLLVDDFNEAAAKKDLSLFVTNMPDRLVHEMAVRMNATEAALRQNLQAQMEKQIAAQPDFIYTLDKNNIEFLETKRGTFYALVPTHLETKELIIDSMTPALYENTKWHLLYGGVKAIQNSIFLDIYPAFEDVKFPPAKITQKK